MDGTRDGQISLRPPEDIAGEGMWRIASGESCKLAGKSFQKIRRSGGELAPFEPSKNG